MAKALMAASAPKSTMEKWVAVVVVSLSVVSLIFSLGVNWSRLGALEKLVGDVNVRELRTQFEAQQSDMRGVTNAINAQTTASAVIQSQLAQIQRDLNELKYRSEPRAPR